MSPTDSTAYRTIHEYYMAECLKLARLAEGAVSPNPMVGAVVLNAQGKKVGEGYHARAGEAHAEVNALNQAGAEARGGTLYVSLEPCSHTGKTPPCVNKIVESGIDAVFCGTLDPNPIVAGSGRDALQNHRISVRHGFLEAECLRLNEVFFHYITSNRPFVTLKLAMTMNGKIAARNGQSQWVTGAFSRQYVHYLRSTHDAILTTADTVMADSPQLTVRDMPLKHRQPVRVILDRTFKLDPDDYPIFAKSDETGETWVFTSKIRHNKTHADKARRKQVRVFEVDDSGLGLNLDEVLDALGREKVTSVLVESGGRLAGSLAKDNLVNKLYAFYAPTVTADTDALEAFSGSVAWRINEGAGWKIANTRRLDGDLVVEAYPRKVRIPAGSTKRQQGRAVAGS